MQNIEKSKQKFEKLIKEQLERIEKIKNQKDFVNFDEVSCIKIGICYGDGIGPIIMKSAEEVLKFLLEEEIFSKKVEVKIIDGLTIENRAKLKETVPKKVLEEIKKCDVILKGPTTTPRNGDKWPILESANVFLRKELDLFANLRPVKVEEEGIDWVFFRENTEGAYTLGSCGLDFDGQMAVDFSIATEVGTKRIAKLAFEYAKKNKRKKVSIITKANIIKKTDGKFLDWCMDVAKKYPEIEVDDWYVDIAAAKLVDKKTRKDFDVLILPNLYGDILTDEAAQIQGGVGTAGSANIGKQYAMFEAIHGSAPRMVKEGLSSFADPMSILRAEVLMLNYVGFLEKAKKLEDALNLCFKNDEVRVTGFKDGATTKQFTDFLINSLKKTLTF